MNKITLFFAGIFALCVLTACSDDDEYKSSMPNFAGILFDADVLYTDQTVVAVAVQNKKAKLVDRVEYSWSATNMPSDSTMTWSPSTVIYDQNSTNPTCTFRTPSTPGKYTITFKGAYNMSGQAGNSTSTVDTGDGSIVYLYSPLRSFVNISKSFTVRAR